MATEQKGVDDEQQAQAVVTNGTSSGGFQGRVLDQYRKLKEHAESYPYVWGSYIVVYGGFGLYLTYRWRKLRQTEDRVRGLQERLRKLAQTQDSATAASSSSATSSSSSSATTKATSK
ncbi:unnamed protein product [Linum tenue]|uniref:Uncharacterized protein n=2 Tax=Linum TaxID=4005 RepID=A0AAV0N9D8_9ROSI|nr:unnamed protein product [Linum tenue]